MDDRLIDDTRLSIARRSVIPGEGFFVPDSVEADAEEQAARQRLDGADVVVVADDDADGLACVALLQSIHSNVAYLPAGPHEIESSLRRVADHGEAGIAVYVCDLCPDSYDTIRDPLSGLSEKAESIYWYDHHNWDPTIAEAIRTAGVDLVLGESNEECTADVVIRSSERDFPERLRELAAVTRDHDLWIKADPRSDDLADFARWADDDATYIETVLEHGPDLPAGAMELIEDRRELKDALIDQAIGRSEFHEIGPWTVAITYGRCSQNEVCESLRAQGADASVVIKPSGPVSIRGSDSFTHCHDVAGKIGGGGHPKAAGCKPDVYEDMLDYAHHWTTRGATTKCIVKAAFQELFKELNATDDHSMSSDGGATNTEDGVTNSPN